MAGFRKVSNVRYLVGAPLALALLVAVGCGGRKPPMDDGEPRAPEIARSSKARSSPLTPGRRSPSFETQDQMGRLVSSQELTAAGDAVVVIFPSVASPAARSVFDWATRTNQLLRQAGNAELVLVSGDLPEANAKAARESGVRLAILSDPDGRIAGAFGVAGDLDEKGGKPARARGIHTFVLGSDGRIHLATSGLAPGPDIVSAMQARLGNAAQPEFPF